MTICEPPAEELTVTSPAPATSTDVAAPSVERTPAVIRLLVLATFIVILNETIMINAIPRLMGDLEHHRAERRSGCRPRSC